MSVNFAGLSIVNSIAVPACIPLPPLLIKLQFKMHNVFQLNQNRFAYSCQVVFKLKEQCARAKMSQPSLLILNYVTAKETRGINYCYIDPLDLSLFPFTSQTAVYFRRQFLIKSYSSRAHIHDIITMFHECNKKCSTSRGRDKVGGILAVPVNKLIFSPSTFLAGHFTASHSLFIFPDYK